MTTRTIPSSRGDTIAHAHRQPVSRRLHHLATGLSASCEESEQFLRERKPFTGCRAGHAHFHVDPHGKASICKVGRDPNVSLINEGIDGLRKLGHIADSLMLRTGGRVLREIADNDPQPWKQRMASAAREWADERMTPVGT